MIGIGIIGAGRVCAAHALAALALPETRLAALADIDTERAAQAAEKYGCRACVDYRQILQDPEVEAVIVGLPHWLHKEAVLRSLEAGKHILVEKPMAMTAAECDVMINAARSCRKTLMVGHSQHFFPANIAVKRFIAESGIGRVVLATDTWYKPFYDGVRPAWFLDDARGGGMWPMNGSHMIDRLTFLLGSEVVSVRARVGNPIFGLSTDMGAAFLEFASGACATIAHAGYRSGVTRFEAEITGTEGQIRLSGDRGGGEEFWISKDGRWEAVPVEPADLPTRPGAAPPSPVFGAEVREFALSVLEGRPPSVTAEYGRQVVRVLEACVESSRTGREVVLEGEGKNLS